MRLRLFDRIRRLAHSRRPPAEAVPVRAVPGSRMKHTAAATASCLFGAQLCSAGW